MSSEQKTAVENLTNELNRLLIASEEQVSIASKEQENVKSMEEGNVKMEQSMYACIFKFSCLENSRVIDSG